MTSVRNLTDRVRDLLLAGPVPRRISDHDPAFQELCAVVSRHPRVEEKVGSGVDAFWVYYGFGGHVALDILRVDGTRVDVSWRKCATGADLTPALKVRRAMRYAVRDQILDVLVRWEIERPPCPLCGQTITGKTHVDHVAPFEEIVQHFCFGRHDIPTDFAEDEATHRLTFADESAPFVLAWRAFHGRFATLRVTHATCNLTRPKEPSQ